MNQKEKKGIFLAVMLAAVSVRITFTGVGALLSLISEEYGLSSGTAGILTTLPLFAFGACSMPVSTMCRRLGEGRTLFFGIFTILLGVLIRSYGGLWGLYLGTIILGAGVAVGNVLLPAVAKGKFPGRMGDMVGLYSVAMGLSSALAIGAAVPFAKLPNMGWRNSLALGALPVVAALFSWYRERGMQLENTETLPPRPVKEFLKQPLAWDVTLYFGITSLTFYSIISWLPTILQSSGISPTEAGGVVSMFQLVGIPTSLLAPLWAGKRTDQRLPLFLGTSISLVGLLLLIVSRSYALTLIAVILMGLSNGSNFSLGLALFGFRTKNAADAAVLSGLAQSIGYLLAATGPFVMGWLYDAIPNWSICLLYLVGFGILCIILGLRAGADKTI